MFVKIEKRIYYIVSNMFQLKLLKRIYDSKFENIAISVIRKLVDGI